MSLQYHDTVPVIFNGPLYFRVFYTGLGDVEVEGRRRRGKPRLRWEDCAKGDLVEMGGVENESEG